MIKSQLYLEKAWKLSTTEMRLRAGMLSKINSRESVRNLQSMYYSRHGGNLKPSVAQKTIHEAAISITQPEKLPRKKKRVATIRVKAT